MFKNKIVNKSIALFMAFLIVFTVTSVNYSKTKCIKVYGADIGLVIGGGYAVETVVKWTLAMLAAMGVTAYALDNKEDIKETAKDVSLAYNQYLIDEKNATVQSGRVYADLIDKALISAQNNIDKGIEKGIAISNDVYTSFKSFLNDYLDSASLGTSEPTDTEIIYNNDINYGLRDGYYGFHTGNASINYRGTVYSGSVNAYNYSLNNISPSGRECVARSIVLSIEPFGYNWIAFNLCVFGFDKNMELCGSSYQKIYSNNYYNGWDNAIKDISNITSNVPVFIAHTSTPDRFGSLSSEQNLELQSLALSACVAYKPLNSASIPTWKQGLIDNNDVIDFGSRTHVTDNYDVVYPGSAVVDDNGNIVGQRAVNLPSVDAYQKLLNKYHNGELTFQELMDALQKLIGVSSLDSGGVIVRENDLVIPQDTPVIGGIGINDRTIEDSKPIRKVIEDEQEQEMLKDDSFKGFPDLSTIFPFCIPFDLVRVLKLLVAEPETPYFEIPFKYDKIGLDYTFVIDFTQFSNLAMITRAFFIIIYIIALILLTRRIIRG